MHFDEFSLATAIRDSGFADGQAALNMAVALLVRLATRDPETVAEPEIEHAAKKSELASEFATVGAER